MCTLRIIGHPDMANMWASVAAGRDKIDWETFKWGLTDKLEANVSSQLKSWFAEDKSRWNRFKARCQHLLIASHVCCFMQYVLSCCTCLCSLSTSMQLLHSAMKVS